MAQTVAEKLHKLDFDDEVTGLIYGHVFRTSEPPQRVSSQQACQAYQTLSPGEGFICRGGKMAKKPLRDF